MGERDPRPERLLSRESRRFSGAPYAADRIAAGWQYVIPGCERPPAARDTRDAHNTRNTRQDESDA